MTDPISVNKIASSIMRNYDQNKDGVIDLKNDRISIKKEGKFTSYNTRDEFFKKADADNDGKVFKNDVIKVIELFDEDHDGILNGEPSFFDIVKSKIGLSPEKKNELQNFNNNFPENSKRLSD